MATDLRRYAVFAVAAWLAATPGASAEDMRGTADLGLVVERASGSVLIVETTARTSLGRVTGLGDLSHASAVFSRDGRMAYVFGRDGGLNKVDLLSRALVKRITQAGNSIGGAISQDGRIIAVANYEPGGVRLFDAASLAAVGEIPALFGPEQTPSKVVGLADAPGQKFVFTLYDGGEIWLADVSDPARLKVDKYPGIGRLPYDGLITPDGRTYVAGLFGEDGLAKLDLWRPEAGVSRILDGYGRGEDPMPVYKMPHLRGWAVSGGHAFLPAIGRHELLVVDTRSWREAARVTVHGQPVFAIASPAGRHVWVNFAHPRNDTVQIVDVATMAVTLTLRPGKAVMHMEFTPRGEQVWLSLRDENRVDVYDTRSFVRIASIPARAPSGILLAARANRIGF